MSVSKFSPIDKSCNPQRYSFEYYNLGALPEYVSKETDHWGYFNGRKPDYTNFYNSREPNEQTMEYGTLNKIYWPTGGYTRLEYEPHSYSSVIDRATNILIPQNKNITAGGLRIKAIYQNPSTENQNEYMSRSYTYNKIPYYGTSSESSGILNKMILYNYDGVELYNREGKCTLYKSVFSSQSILPSCENSCGMHVGYSNVTEHFPDGSFRNHFFTNYDTGNLDDQHDASLQFYSVQFNPYSSREQERGLEYIVRDYDANNNLKQDYQCNYEKSDSRYIRTIKKYRESVTWDGFYNIYGEGYAYRNHIYSMRKKFEIVKRYESNAIPITDSIIYSYNSKNQIHSIKTRLNSNCHKEITYSYPIDQISDITANSNIYKQMVEANLLSPVVSYNVRHYDKGNNPTNILNVNNNYQKSNLYKPYKPVSVSFSVGGYKPEKRIEYYYDSIGNISQFMQDGVVTSYIWGYKNRYPVAVLKNIPLSAGYIYRYIGNVYTFGKNEEPNFAALDSLIRISYRSSPASLVTTAKYRPHFGIENKIEANQMIQYFGYDGFGRLEYVWDNYHQMMQRLRYQYSPDAKNYIENKLITKINGLSDSIKTKDFYDGLGRKIQTQNIASSPDGSDIVNYIEYDCLGRIIHQWLPTSVGSDGTFVDSNILLNSYRENFPDNSVFKSTITYENSLSKRVSETKLAGDPWQTVDGKKQKYYINTLSGELSAPLYVVKNRSLYKDGNYASGELKIEELIDEDNHRSLIFKDRNDSTILSRSILDGKCIDTHYVYDIYGCLRYVITPKASECLNNRPNGEVPDNDEIIESLCYIYRYDYRNRLIEKKLPGAATIYYAYDMSDKLIYSQDGRQRAKNEWSCYAYDNLERLVYSGVLKTLKSADNIRNSIKGQRKRVDFSLSGDIYGYTKIDENLKKDDINQVKYFDDYKFLDIFGESKQELTYRAMNGYGRKYSKSVVNSYDNNDTIDISARGMLTGNMIRVFDAEGSMLKSAIYYDYHGDVIQTRESNHLGGYDVKYYNLTFTGKPLSVRHEYSTADTAHVDVSTYSYDRMERLLTATLRHDDNEDVVLYSNTYNSLGQLSSQSVLDGRNPINYSYNLHGWMTEMQSSSFSQQLYYEPTEVNPNGCYNGNISRQTWLAMQGLPNSSSQQHGGTYSYNYDGLNRLTTAKFSDPYHFHKGNLGIPVVSHDRYQDEDYLSRFEYDANCNLTAIFRKGQTDYVIKNSRDKTYLYGTIDSIAIEREGNQLKKVTDYADEVALEGSLDFKDGAEQSVEYAWDANGNMTKDLNKGITQISYNFMNLPERIRFSDGHETRYTYDASGRKLKVKYLVNKVAIVEPVDPIAPELGEAEMGVTPLGLIDITNPEEAEVAMTTVLTRDYCGNYIYEDGSLERILTENGYIDRDGTYCAYIKDYQGNNRVSIDENGATHDITAYYPYGMPFTPFNGLDRYKYSGKEFDPTNGLNLYDFSARLQNSALCDFSSQDPKATDYTPISPYAYCAGNPIANIDPDGMDIYRFDNTNGIVYLHEKTTDNYDQIGDFKYDKNSKTYTLKKDRSGNVKTKIDKIEKGILKNEMNFCNNSNVWEVGNDGSPSVDGFQQFAIEFSEMIGKEVAGFYFTEKDTNELKYIFMGSYKNNKYDRSYTSPGIFNVRRDLNGKIGYHTSWHTHPSTANEAHKLRPSESDLDFKASQESFGFKFFIILTKGYQPISY